MGLCCLGSLGPDVAKTIFPISVSLLLVDALPCTQINVYQITVNHSGVLNM
jgi:hypothetical protein